MKFIPHEYQKFAVKFIHEHAESMLLLDMGLGLIAVVNFIKYARLITVNKDIHYSITPKIKGRLLRP